MGDMAEMYRAMDAANKQHREQMLAEADVKGWEAHSEYHFHRFFGKTRVDWWPSGGKAQVHTKGSGTPPRMVYGRKRVAALIEQLKKEHPDG